MNDPYARFNVQFQQEQQQQPPQTVALADGRQVTVDQLRTEYAEMEKQKKEVETEKVRVDALAQVFKDMAPNSQQQPQQQPQQQEEPPPLFSGLDMKDFSSDTSSDAEEALATKLNETGTELNNVHNVVQTEVSKMTEALEKTNKELEDMRTENRQREAKESFAQASQKFGVTQDEMMTVYNDTYIDNFEALGELAQFRHAAQQAHINQQQHGVQQRVQQAQTVQGAQYAPSQMRPAAPTRATQVNPYDTESIMKNYRMV